MTLVERNGNQRLKVLRMRDGFKTIKDLQDDVRTFFEPDRETNLNLFEIACLGKPELALQGELIHYLRTCNWFCVHEAGYRELPPGADKTSSPNLDILVFDRGEGNFMPFCCIELKHFSANQGPPNVLITGLSADYERPRPANVPLMLVGMYTTIIRATNQPEPSGLHRFARAVCGPVKDHLLFSQRSRIGSDPRQTDQHRLGCTHPVLSRLHQNRLKAAFCRRGSNSTVQSRLLLGFRRYLERSYYRPPCITFIRSLMI